jgi:hypothetical protein
VVQTGCCGAAGPSDYKTFTWNDTFTLLQYPIELTVSPAAVPPSCCMMLYRGWIPDNIKGSFIGLGQCLNGLQYINSQVLYHESLDRRCADHWSLEINGSAGDTLTMTLIDLVHAPPENTDHSTNEN